MKKNIFILNTGGTLSMQRQSEGYANSPGYLAECLQTMPELENAALPQFELVEYQPLLDSANISPVIWNQMACDIAARYDQYDGFVILHGTDTMAYSSSVLSFILQNLSKPVVFTGSQVPLEQAHGDARENLINALGVAQCDRLQDVALCFHDVLLRGSRAKKVSSTRYDAFASPNCEPLAKIDAEIQFNSNYTVDKSEDAFSIVAIKDVNIASVKLFPGMRSNYLEALLDSPLDVLILGTYGVGNAPTLDTTLMQILKRAHAQGVMLISCTQCHHGSVDLNTYASGTYLADIGFVGALDMTIEAVIAKLYYLFSLDLSRAEIAAQFQQDLRGELTDIQ